MWPTLVTGANGAQTLALFYATSKDGRTFTPRQRVPASGVPRHPQIAVAADGRVVIAWDESDKGLRHVPRRRLHRRRHGRGMDERHRRGHEDPGRADRAGVSPVRRS